MSVVTHVYQFEYEGKVYTSFYLADLIRMRRKVVPEDPHFYRHQTVPIERVDTGVKP